MQQARRRALTLPSLSTTQPTADDLFLHAHDAHSPPSSRFQRFRFFVGALIVVYRTSHVHNDHDSGAVARLKGVKGSLERVQQAHAFAALPLELQVSAVAHARELVFDACKRAQDGHKLLDSGRVVRRPVLLFPLLSSLPPAQPGTDASSSQVGLLEAAFLGHQPAVAAPADFVSVSSSPSLGPPPLQLDDTDPQRSR